MSGLLIDIAKVEAYVPAPTVRATKSSCRKTLQSSCLLAAMVAQGILECFLAVLGSRVAPVSVVEEVPLQSVLQRDIVECLHMKLLQSMKKII